MLDTFYILNLSMSVNKIVQLIDLQRYPFLKASQYLCLFLAWFQQRNKTQMFPLYFSIYQKLFHSRRLFRLLRSLFLVPEIRQLVEQLKVKLSFMALFKLLGKIFTCCFYAMDNMTILSMIMGFAYYKAVRRVSYSILFLSILFFTISLFIELRQSFQRESQLKKELQNFTPSQLLTELSRIDEKRKVLGIKLLQAFGDFFPTLARTNLPEIIFRTKINKGTVGFFGVASAITEMYLRSKEQSSVGL